MLFLSTIFAVFEISAMHNYIMLVLAQMASFKDLFSRSGMVRFVL